MIPLDKIKAFILLYFSKQFVYFVIAGGLSALLNFLVRLFIRPYFDIVLSAVLAYCVALVFAFFLYRRFVFPFSEIPLAVQGRRFLLIQLSCMPIVVMIFSSLSKLFYFYGLGEFSEPLAHAISIGMPALITFLLYKLFVFVK